MPTSRGQRGCVGVVWVYVRAAAAVVHAPTGACVMLSDLARAIIRAVHCVRPSSSGLINTFYFCPGKRSSRCAGTDRWHIARMLARPRLLTQDFI